MKWIDLFQKIAENGHMNDEIEDASFSAIGSQTVCMTENAVRNAEKVVADEGTEDEIVFYYMTDEEKGLLQLNFENFEIHVDKNNVNIVLKNIMF